MGFFKSLGNSISHEASHIGGELNGSNLKKAAIIGGTVGTLGVMGATPIGAAASVNAAPGQKNDYVLGGNKQYQLGQAADAENAFQQRQQQAQDNLLGEADAVSGVGLSPEAMGNASRLRVQRDATARDALKAGVGAADANYASGLTSSRIGLARSGGIGGGQEAQDRSDLLGKYFGDVTGAQQGANQAANTFDANVSNNRSMLRTAVRGGQITDATGLPSQITGLQGQGQGANTLWSSVGQFLPVAAGASAAGQLRRAQA